MKEVIAMHGWYGDSSTWQLWRHHFEKYGWHWQSNEHGYGAANSTHANWSTLTNTNQKEQRVIIAHSLGPHLLNSDVLSKATEIVFLCSFGQFLPRDSSNTSIEVAVKNMQGHLGTPKEETMLTSFLQKASFPLELEAIPKSPIHNRISIEGRLKLKADLELLRSTKGLPKDLPSTARVLVIEGVQDQIVTPQARQALLTDLIKHLQHPPVNWKIAELGHILVGPELIQNVRIWLESFE